MISTVKHLYPGQQSIKYNQAFWPTILSVLAVSGRKLAIYYACIKHVPNTVLNFGIFYKIFYIFNLTLSRILN
nr:hypothetical protein [Mucilaginibacter sp. SP1R1]